MEFAPEPTRLRVLVIYNPRAGWRRRQKFASALTHLAELGCVVTVRTTKGQGHAEILARRAAGEEVDVVVAAGGDGTINEVINGLAGRNMPLGILPLGTANVLAAELGVPRTAAGAAQVIAGGKCRTIYLGQANGRRFAQMAGVGFDAHVVASVHPMLKRFTGRFAYVYETWHQFLRFPFPAYRVRFGNEEVEVGSIVAAKGHYYAGRFTLAPAARLDEPVLHLCLLTGRGPFSAFRYAAAMVLGRIEHSRGVRILSVTQATIEGPAGDPVQGDGEVLTQLPLTLTMAEECLAVVVPG